MNNVSGGLVDLDDTKGLWLALDYHGYLRLADRPFRRAIAEEIRELACKFCIAIPADIRLDEGLTHTRGKRMKHITVHNYIWEWLHGTHTTTTI